MELLFFYDKYMLCLTYAHWFYVTQSLDDITTGNRVNYQRNI